jgi:hypothetical protein
MVGLMDYWMNGKTFVTVRQTIKPEIRAAVRRRGVAFDGRLWFILAA